MTKTTWNTLKLRKLERPGRLPGGEPGDTNRILIRKLGILRILIRKLRILQTHQKDHDVAMRVKYQELSGGEPGDTNRILRILIRKLGILRIPRKL